MLGAKSAALRVVLLVARLADWMAVNSAAHLAALKVAPSAILLVGCLVDHLGGQSVGRLVAESAVNSVERLAASKESPSEKNLVECWDDYLDVKQVECSAEHLVLS